MYRPILSIIAAVDEHRGIGKDNTLLWHIPADMKRFRTLTSGHPVIMGRKTYESIGRPLPNRTNIIVTHDPAYTANSCIIAHSLEEAIGEAKKHDQEEIFIIGGAQLYAQAISMADKLYLTLVHKTFDADTFFPDYSRFTHILHEEIHNENGLSFTFRDLSST